LVETWGPARSRVESSQQPHKAQEGADASAQHSQSQWQSSVEGTSISADVLVEDLVLHLALHCMQ
jgi:hypothetical protein